MPHNTARVIDLSGAAPRKHALFCASMLGGMLAAATALAAPALPTGGRVAAGAASIGVAGSVLTVSQSSAKAIVDWSSFGVGQGGTVQFDNGSGATLNRVTGTGVSSIDGLLSATGSVYLINPNGVIVGKSGAVNTGGSFVASTLDVSNASFLAGGPLSFSGLSTASVINLGKVGSLGGNVGLIAATVRNDGTIAAQKGDVGLAAGTTVTLDDAANDAGGLFSVKVGGASTSVINTGAIAAAAAELRAQQGNVYALAGNAGGVIDATGIDGSGGSIKLISEGGTTTVTGSLSARGANGAGGQIETSGASLDIGGATVDTHGGSWLLDPTNLIINSAAASVIDAALASGNVTLTTSASGAPTGPTGSTGDAPAGPDDIIVAAPITWSTSSSLTLDSYGGLVIDAPITVTGSGAVALDYGVGSNLSFGLGPSGFAGSVSYAIARGDGIAGQALTINGTNYILLYSMAWVAAINGKSADYALAASTTSTATYAGPVVSTFAGTLEGLGNTISGLTIYSGAKDVGLIGTLSGHVRDLGLVGGTVEGSSYVGQLVGYNQGQGSVLLSYANGATFGVSEVGGLVGQNLGSVESSHAGGTVSGTDQAIGGLVGANSGPVGSSFATAGVTGPDEVGGLVGVNSTYYYNYYYYASGSIATSYATGAVSGVSVASGQSEDIGGLVGSNTETITASHATGAVSGTTAVGGLVGASSANQVSGSYATGAVSGTTEVGGLVGVSSDYMLVTSYATGSVTGTSQVGGLVGYKSSGYAEKDFATGAVSGTSDVGGLVGQSIGTFIETSFANGAVSGNTAVGGLVGWNDDLIENSDATGAVSGSKFVGGLVGYGDTSGTIETSYATGAISGSTYVGGIEGYNAGAADISNTYFDTQTAFSSGGHAVGGGNPTPGALGLTTAQLQSNYSGYMTNLGSAFGGGTGGLYPYLVNFFPSGVQAIVGTATSGGSPAGAAQVGIYSGGVLLGDGTVSTGANGYIYLAVAAGTLGASGDKVGADLTLAGGTAPTGLVYTGVGTVTSNVLTLPTLAAGQNVQTTGELTLSALRTDLSAAFGAATYAGLQSALATTPLTIDAIGASFTVNQALAWGGAGALSLDAAGLLAIDAPVTVTGAGQVALTYGAGGLSFGLGPSGFAGSLSYAAGTGEGIAGQALTINGQSYTLVYSMADLAGLDNGTGHDALVAPITASGVGLGAVVGVFYGTLDGLGHSISGLTINSPGNYVGLFGELDHGGVVRDIGLSGGSIRGVNFVGGLVGYNEIGATIESVITGGATITASGDDVGGLAGANQGLIDAGRSTDTVDNSGAGRASGGLVGANGANGSIFGGVTSVGSVTAIGGVEVGGLVGLNDGSISGSSAAEKVVDNNHGYAVGGLVGYNAAGAVVTGSAASGPLYVGDNVRYAGGLAGYNDGAISNDSSTATVNAAVSMYVGGLVGYNAAAGTIGSSYASGGDVDDTGGVAVGGVAGFNAGTISDTYADLSVVLGGPFVGGMVGYNAGDVATSWSSGEVAGTSASVGGAIGDQAGGTLTNDYWDEGTSGQSHATGLGGSSAGLTAIGGTTGIDPHAQATYTGFDFTTTWTIQPGVSRPYLLNPLPKTPPN